NSGWIPRLSFGASTGSQYYSVSGFDNESFASQMRHNHATYFGFTLTVPLFDAFSTRNAVRRARLQHLQATLEAERRETEIEKTIRMAHTQAVTSRDQYRSSQQSLAAVEKAFEAVSEKFSLGRATSYEYQQASNNLYRTRISAIQARYDYLLRCRILDFYQSGSANRS
ncbi:MAG: TolC family protein, partial [Muribaculaceae bacterium]|nr:TolC family protein [Muribaculaceae bacterium]